MENAETPPSANHRRRSLTGSSTISSYTPHGHIPTVRKRSVAHDHRRARCPAALGATRHVEPARNQVWLRPRHLRRLHRARRRRRDSLVRHACLVRILTNGYHHRGSRSDVSASVTAGMDRRRRTTVRLLPGWANHDGRLAAGGEAEADRSGHRRCDVEQLMPVRHLRPHPSRDQARGERAIMNRRSFLKVTVTASGGFLLSFYADDLTAVGAEV